MKSYNTTRFGKIKVDDRDVIFITLLGFPGCDKWTLIQEDRMQPFVMLQSLDNPKLAFCVVDPLDIRPDFKFSVSMTDLNDIKAITLQGLDCYCIIDLTTDKTTPTVNLIGPLVINKRTMLGKQIILSNSDYTTRESIIKKETDIMVSRELKHLLANQEAIYIETWESGKVCDNVKLSYAGDRNPESLEFDNTLDLIEITELDPLTEDVEIEEIKDEDDPMIDDIELEEIDP